MPPHQPGILATAGWKNDPSPRSRHQGLPHSLKSAGTAAGPLALFLPGGDVQAWRGAKNSQVQKDVREGKGNGAGLPSGSAGA